MAKLTPEHGLRQYEKRVQFEYIETHEANDLFTSRFDLQFVLRRFLHVRILSDEKRAGFEIFI